KLDSSAQVLHGLGIRRAIERLAASLEPVIHRSVMHTAFGEMVRHDLGLPLHEVAESVFEHLGNLPVQLLPAALEHALISRVPHQRVLERVGGVRWLSVAEDELRLLEL